MAKKQDLSELSDTDLIELLDETKDELLNLRFQSVTGQLDNNQLIGSVRKQVARIHTQMRMREIAAAEAGALTEADQ